MSQDKDDTQVRVAKITAFQAIVVTLITVLGSGIGYFVGSAGSSVEKAAPANTQRWLVIHGIDGPSDQSVRIVASVNSVIYAYPADVPYTKIGMNMPEQKLPLPSGTDSYTVGFEAQFKTGTQGGFAVAKSRARPQFSANSLPRDRQQYSLHAVIEGEKQAEVALTVLYSFM